VAQIRFPSIQKIENIATQLYAAGMDARIVQNNRLNAPLLLRTL
jgi:hypothetical protein